MKIALLLLLTFIMGCAINVPYDAKHNWNKSNYLLYDGVVAITIKKKRHWCTGIVLNPDFVMTAGHCADPRLYNLLYITSGCNDITAENCTHTKVVLAVPHPNHKESGPIWNDIGAMKPMESIKGITSATLTNQIETQSTINLAGFGGHEGKTGILWAGKSKINHFWAYGFETYLNGKNGPCGGDSGSPAFDEAGKVVGILSRSVRNKKSDCGGIATYTMPAMYIGWLREMNTIFSATNASEADDGS
ncbi:hypothetical protein LCGC14_1157240 [marine sediment metagenome]|uniref:Peptidase S1 domain-containing protein n=1 Tax=marine sediment metagenome TaxID=412755 RepID=A0A0F9LYP9_9ZZZZ